MLYPPVRAIMATTYNLWSQHFLLDAPSDPATCFVAETDWHTIHEEVSEAKRIFARIERDDQVLFCALGQPVRISNQSGDFERGLFLPSWFLDHLALPGAGEPFEVEWVSEEGLPEATKIVLRPHDSAFYHADAKEELEAVLTRYGVVHRGTTISVPLACLGGYEIPIDILRTEPANILLTEGDEVAIEFESALDEAPLAYEPVARVGRPSDVRDWSGSDSTLGEEPMIASPSVERPLPALAPISGQRLGGSAVRMTADGRRWNPWRDGPMPKE